MENVDIDFSNLTRHQVISKYLESLRQLKLLAEESCSIRSLEFDNYIFFQYFQQSDRRDSDGTIGDDYLNSINSNISLLKAELVKQIIDRKRKILFLIFYLTLGLLCISYKNEASTLVLRNVQTFIYPGMKHWRKITLPVIQNFPGLTELYDESCLVLNPFFQVDDLNCEPCANVVNVLDLTRVEKTTEFVPFIFRINQPPVTINDLHEIYDANKDIFDNDAYRVRSSNREITSLDELFMDFNKSHQIDSHTLWRSNRMPPARLLRQLFMRPGRLPNTGISLERYLSIDTENAPLYSIPDAECSNMYIQQALGTRTIILRSTVECRHKCRTLSVRLPQSFVLSYNWWYWKPVSAPDPMAKSISISLIGSYC